MEFRLILALCLSMVLCDKLDRTYLPPEGSVQSSGDPGELELPYEDHDNNKGKDIGLQRSPVIDPAKSGKLERQKFYRKNTNPNEVNNKNTQNRLGSSSRGKQKPVDDFRKNNNQRDFKIYNNSPNTFGNAEQSLFRANMNIDNNSDTSGELNPYLPLQKQANQGSDSRFEVNVEGELDLNDSNATNNFKGNINLTNHVLNFNKQNIRPIEDKSKNASTGSFERKSEIEMTDLNNYEQIPQHDNAQISDSNVVNSEIEKFRQTTEENKNIGSLDKHFKTSLTRPSRPQAQNDRNAEIINYQNYISPEDGEFAFSFDTSNGIHVDEHGTANDGVKAEGGYSYTGDDGKVYTIRYTADKNGFQPTGDHLPTPPPIPEAILRVIELAMQNKVNGVPEDDGMYDENKYGYQNYDSGFVANTKIPHSKTPLEVDNYESVPESRQSTKKYQESIGDKELYYRDSDVDTVMSAKDSSNTKYDVYNNGSELDLVNGDREINKQTPTEYRTINPAITRYGVQQQPFSQQTALDNQNRSNIVTEHQNKEGPFNQHFRMNINKNYEPNSAINIQQKQVFDNRAGIDNAHDNIKSHSNYTASENQKQFDTDVNPRDNNSRFYNLQEINRSPIHKKTNGQINQNNQRHNYDIETTTGYRYLAPSRVFMMNPNIPDLKTNFRQEDLKTFPKPQLTYMLQKDGNRRPVNRGNNRPDIEKSKVIVRLGTIKTPASEEYLSPKAYDIENGSELTETEKTRGNAVVNNNVIGTKPNERTNIFHDNLNFEQFNNAAGNPEKPVNPEGHAFNGPKQIPYFDSETGYHY